METIVTKDPKVALLNICRRNCNKMHALADLMKSVLDLKKRCGDSGEFTSARTPECLDRIMEELVYAFRCEANCDVMEARAVFDGNAVELPKYFDENGQKVETGRD